MKKEKNYTFREFKQFLSEKCFDERKYGEGKYDRKIYNWFDLGKPRKVEFYKADGSSKDLEDFIRTSFNQKVGGIINKRYEKNIK